MVAQATQAFCHKKPNLQDQVKYIRNIKLSGGHTFPNRDHQRLQNATDYDTVFSTWIH